MDNEKEIQELIKQLSDPNENVRWNAARELRYAAEEGQDVTSAIPALGIALGDKNNKVRYHAALALTTADSNGNDITPAVPALGNALNDGNETLRGCAAEVLATAALREQDITSAIPALGNALNDENRDIRQYAARALTYHYVNKREWNKVEELLKHENANVRNPVTWMLADVARRGRDIPPVIPALGNKLTDKNFNFRIEAAETLRDVAESGRDITPAVPALISALIDMGGAVCGDDAAKALIFYCMNKGEWKKIGELLEHKNEDVKFRVARAIFEIAKKCESIETLDMIQKTVEDNYREWLRKQPQGISKEKIERQIETSQLLMAIAERKAELSKKDGLQLGDTIKKPKDGKKIYQSIRRVTANG